MADNDTEYLADIVWERVRAHGVDNLMDLVRVMQNRTGQRFTHTTLRSWADKKQTLTPHDSKLEQFARGTSGPGIDGEGRGQSYEDILRRLYAATGRKLPVETVEVNPRFAKLRTANKLLINNLIVKLDVAEGEMYKEALERARAEVRANPLHAVPEEEDDGDGDDSTSSGAG